MRLGHLPIRNMCLLIGTGALLSMLAITAVLYALTSDMLILLGGGVLTACALVWLYLLVLFFGRRLSVFTVDLCRTLDNMISGNGELELLVSDISHQVKTPVSNLKMVTDTLLTRPVTDWERTDFLQCIRSQTDKLDFLFQALVKTSRLENGVIRLEKKDGLLFDILAQAMSGIVYGAEKKIISVTVDCPENLLLCHNSKWTAEALFNLLDNAVKYTPVGGKISVLVEQWEMYVKLDVADTGKGISESNQASIFRRFHREEEVHDEPALVSACIWPVRLSPGRAAISK